MSKSDLEDALAYQIEVAGLPDPVTEHRFHPPRRWRFDFCWPDQMLAVEVDGGGYVYGRHNRPEGQEKDAEKYNQAVLDGWRVLRYVSKHVDSGWAVAEIERALHAP